MKQRPDGEERTRFELKRVSGMPVTDEELLADLRITAARLGKNTIGMHAYRELGKYNYTTIGRRFGSWNKALQLAGLSLLNEVNISEDRLFENLLLLWQHYGRQPRRHELAKPPSAISQTPYSRRFGSWLSALTAFVDYANSSETNAPMIQSIAAGDRKTGRDPSLRLRWHALKRDRFSCVACGANPACTPGVELHVDHIIPWSKGGETVLNNLQTLCAVCNLGKSNTR